MTTKSQLLATILEMEGYQVEHVDCGYTAIAKIEASPPQLVLLDLMTLETNGFEVTKWIRQNQPGVAIVLVVDACQLPELPCHLQLPINVDEVVSTVQAIFSDGISVLRK